MDLLYKVFYKKKLDKSLYSILQVLFEFFTSEPIGSPALEKNLYIRQFDELGHLNMYNKKFTQVAVIV